MRGRRWLFLALGLLLGIAGGAATFWIRSGIGERNRLAENEYRALKEAGWRLDASDYPGATPTSDLAKTLATLATEAEPLLEKEVSTLEWTQRRGTELRISFGPLFAFNARDPLATSQYMIPLRTVVKAVAAAAVESAKLGRREQTSELLSIGRKLASASQSNDLLTSSLVRVGLNSIMRTTAVHVISLRPIWESDFSWIESEATQMNAYRTLQAHAHFELGAYRGASIRSVRDYRWLQGGIAEGPDAPYTPGDGLPQDLIVRAFLGPILSVFRQAADLLGPDGAPIDSETVRSQLNRIIKATGSGVTRESEVLFVIRAALDTQQMEIAAGRRYGVIRRAVQYRNAQGRWPTTEALGPLPTNPFQPGKPMLVEITGDALTITSPRSEHGTVFPADRTTFPLGKVTRS